MATTLNSRYKNRSRAAALVIAAAIAVATVLVMGYAAGTLALLARCGENIPADRLDGCRWLEDDGWAYLPIYAASLPVLAGFLAYWRRSAWLMPVATLLALVVAVPTPFVITG